MTKRLFNIILVLLAIPYYSNGQALKEKVEKLFESNKRLLEQTHEFYNLNGQKIKEVKKDYRSNESITTTDYLYNEKGQLVKEIFAGKHSFHDYLKRTHWTDNSVISIMEYMYDPIGRIKFKKEYSFECQLDTCDIEEFFYEGKLLTKKFCTNNCSMKGLKYNYPIYYKYDKNDSLLIEQAMGPKDTTKIWYKHIYSYLPDKVIYEKFYRNNDSLQLDSRIVSKTEYLSDGRKSKVIFLERNLSYEDLEYYKNGLLKSTVSFSKGIPRRKLVYYYDKRKNIIQIKTFNKDEDKENKLKLNYNQTYEYTYY